MINTSQGSKSPAEALELLKKAKMPAGSLLGIFNQLEGYPECQEARAFVLANPSLYSDKLQRLAKEKSTGRPVGAKVINNESDLKQVLRACGLRARVAITILKDKARSIRMMLFMNNLEISDMDKSGLAAVSLSGEWQFVPRTFTATLTLGTEEALMVTQIALFGIVEKIEIMSTLGERVAAYRAPNPLSDNVKEMLASNTDLFYDRGLFLEVCKELSFNRAEVAEELPGNATMEDMLMVFTHNSSREEFLECYIEHFNTALAPT